MLAVSAQTQVRTSEWIWVAVLSMQVSTWVSMPAAFQQTRALMPVLISAVALWTSA